MSLVALLVFLMNAILAGIEQFNLAHVTTFSRAMALFNALVAGFVLRTLVDQLAAEFGEHREDKSR